LGFLGGQYILFVLESLRVSIMQFSANDEGRLQHATLAELAVYGAAYLL
jgi:hypothetical protein